MKGAMGQFHQATKGVEERMSLGHTLIEVCE